MRTSQQLVDLIHAFQEQGLTAFQAMAAVLENEEWDMVLAAFEDAAYGNT